MDDNDLLHHAEEVFSPDDRQMMTAGSTLRPLILNDILLLSKIVRLSEQLLGGGSSSRPDSIATLLYVSCQRSSAPNRDGHTAQDRADRAG